MGRGWLTRKGGGTREGGWLTGSGVAHREGRRHAGKGAAHVHCFTALRLRLKRALFYGTRSVAETCAVLRH